jgi:hypothetical protein
MSKAMYGFRPQLRAGRVGEIVFLEANKDSVLKLDGFKSDFATLHTGEGIELKSDLWTMDETPNFFFERWGNEEDQKPGGPWQARGHGSKWFVYFYVPSLVYFRFNTEELVATLESLEPTLTVTRVQNPNYTTVGYRVPRDMVAHLAERVELTVKKKS